MAGDVKQRLSDHPLWVAVESGDLDAARTILVDDATLANRDFRPLADQDPHTHGFPLVRAAESGNLPMVALLLEFGADVDARSPHEDQRELGGPIMHAFERQHYDIVHLLLDHGASLDAHGYYRLVETQLEFLCDQGTLAKVIERGRWDPHFQLAANYLWPNWYGNPQEPSSVASMIQLSELFLEFGFVDLHHVDPDSGETVLTRAKSRRDHPGLNEFVAYLLQQGAQET